jgi:hypothetical protein
MLWRSRLWVDWRVDPPTPATSSAAAGALSRRWLCKDNLRRESKARTFDTIPSTNSGLLASNMILRQSGDFACAAPVIQDGIRRFGYWRLHQDDVFEKILAAGDPAPSSGGGTAVGTFFGANDGGEGPLVLDIGVVGGAFSEAIYVLDDSPTPR